MTAAMVCTPLRSEWASLRGALADPAIRTGRGPSRRIAAAGPVLVAGVAGALTEDLRPGDLVVAADFRMDSGVAASLAAPLLFAAVRRLGLPVRFGPLLSRPRVAGGRDHAALASGALAVDTETAYLADQAPAGQAVALRAIVDTPAAPLARPGTTWRGVRALRALRAAAPAIDLWAAATGDREILLANSRPLRATEAGGCDLILVLGARASADSHRRIRIAEQTRTPAHLVDEAGAVDLRWLAGARRVGIAAASPAPPHLAAELVRCLSGLGRTTVTAV